jgi:hypothetical protein
MLHSRACSVLTCARAGSEMQTCRTRNRPDDVRGPMVTTLQEPSSVLEEPPHDIVHFHENNLFAQNDSPPQGEGSAAERRRRAEGLVAIACGRREPLEALRSRFGARLHRSSDDFEATDGLRVVEIALSQIPRPVGLWAWQRRPQRLGRRRWWGRGASRRASRGLVVGDDRSATAQVARS